MRSTVPDGAPQPESSSHAPHPNVNAPYWALVASQHNPVIHSFCQRLLAVGKIEKLALTASGRKFLTILNSMVKNGRRWNLIVISY